MLKITYLAKRPAFEGLKINKKPEGRSLPVSRGNGRVRNDVRRLPLRDDLAVQVNIETANFGFLIDA